MNQLISVIVPTYNSAQTLEKCLASIKAQTYQPIELIVIDNHSKDTTQSIARAYADIVHTKGPERSAQRNFGVEKASGHYVAIIDSDMELSPEVIAQCVEEMQTREDRKGVIIPEESFGEGFWARCKQLERSFYIGVDWMEAARFFERETYVRLGGYDSNLVSGEDWDLSQRVAQEGTLGRITALIYHNEGRLKLGRTLGKKYYYAKKISQYVSKPDHVDSVSQQTSVLGRYKLFLSKPNQLWRHPSLGVGMLLMKTLEFGAGALGMLVAKRDKAAADG